jgi:hypothetical protein
MVPWLAQAFAGSSPSELGRPAPADVAWEIEVEGARSGLREVVLGGATIEEQVSEEDGVVQILTWTGRGAGAEALRAFRPVDGLVPCPGPVGGGTAAVGRDVVEVRIALPTSFVLTLARSPGVTCAQLLARPTPPEVPPTPEPAPDAPDPERPWADPARPPPAEAVARVRLLAAPTDERAAAWARHVVGWCAATFPRISGTFGWSATAGGWLPDLAPRGSEDLGACVLGGLARLSPEGALKVELAP